MKLLIFAWNEMSDRQLGLCVEEIIAKYFAKKRAELLIEEDMRQVQFIKNEANFVLNNLTLKHDEKGY